MVKLLITDPLYWIGRRDHELGVYRRVAAGPPPVVTPRLRYADQRLVAREIRLHVPLLDNARKTHRLAALARLRGRAADLIQQAQR